MRRIILILISLFVMLTLNNNLCKAQSVGLYGSISMPQGDFGDDSGMEAGLAKTGFGVGMEYYAPLGSPGLEGVFSASLLLNKLDTDPLEDILGLGLDADSWDVDAGSWINIPFIAGCRYRAIASPTMEFFGVGLAGFNIVKGPTILLETTVYDYVYDEYVHIRVEQTLDPAISFGIGIGGGLIVNKKVNIGIRYLSLGEPEINGEIELVGNGERYTEDIEFDQPISILIFTIGITF